jgi:hypothetical protein
MPDINRQYLTLTNDAGEEEPFIPEVRFDTSRRFTQEDYDYADAMATMSTAKREENDDALPPPQQPENANEYPEEDYSED